MKQKTYFSENQKVKSAMTGDVLVIKKIKSTLLVCVDPKEKKQYYAMGLMQPTYILSKKNAIIIN